MTFSDLGLHPALVQTAADLGYEAPSPIQEALVPTLLAGRDAIGQARTGTGKTAAFALPALHKMAGTAGGAVQVLVLTPTRELAVQVASAVHTYGRAFDVRTLPITGGQPYHKQIKRLRRGVDVVVATPGRLVDLVGQGAIDLGHVHTVVLDEADEMFSMGFADDLDAIFDALPDDRQTALLSATMAPAVKRLAQKRLRDPEVVSVTDGDRTAADVEQRGYYVNGRDKLNALVRLLETEDVTSALCFVRTRAGASALAADLSRRGYAAEEISGELSQSQRTAVLARFKNKTVRILCATDVAARGLDIDHVSHVFNVDLPHDPEAYVHRVGRTGRAGRDGVALSLVTPQDRGLLKRVERAAGRAIPQAELPSVEDVEAVRAQRLQADVVAAFETATDADRQLVLDLVTEGRDPMEVAAAAFALARRERGQAPVERIQLPGARRDHGHRPAPSRDRGAPHRGARSEGGEAGYVRLAIDAGYDAQVRPGQVVSAIARTADIPGKALGKILIHDAQTLVDVPADLVDQVLAQSGDLRFGKRLAQIERA
ncbi:DEAD/DEAH box helicase [Rubrivirga sp. S365]|uniref:DEAD/DEAH box helicase n=1 Tax=Rubrivirga litoralis TaxID=3075598 RepID=A0ABU3BSK6_9BACT|nr:MULTISPECIES: DEAD/DEAH box helicase [unclassified Rubrivirga]MDT0632258.1 DEAD/DEAH box helicase [Rubrivirga sp. F394]MDT7856286.1 DEAD/DEAH box helicase [Rubrivirga sp. S365]